MRLASFFTGSDKTDFIAIQCLQWSPIIQSLDLVASPCVGVQFSHTGGVRERGYFQVSFSVAVPAAGVMYVRLEPLSQITFPLPSLLILQESLEMPRAFGKDQ
jgi:hypothetical protein